MFHGKTIRKYVDSDFTLLQQKGSQMKLEIKTTCLSVKSNEITKKEIEAKRCTLSFFALHWKKAKLNSKKI